MTRFGLGLYTLIAVLGVSGACAENSGAPSGGPEETPGPDASSLPESDGGARPLVEAGRDGDASSEILCSEDGWCAPTAPAPAPTFLDLWPLTDTAFAVSPTGILKLEGDRWVYINERYSFGHAIWASSADDVWVAGDLGTVVHGVRENGAWTWTSEKVAGQDPLTAIWGASADDVYVIVPEGLARGGDVYHRVGDARWRSEFRDDVPPDLYNNNIRMLTSISGGGPDDLWISGRRSLLCGYLAHKSRGIYTVIADCTSQCADGLCLAVEKPPLYYDRLFSGTPIQAQTVGAGTAVALRLSNVVRFEHDDGEAFTASRIAVTGLPPGAERWIWGPTETNLFIAGRSQVVHNSAITIDGGPFAISSIALNGAPLRADFKVRGTSASNAWAFGGRYAVHKTKP